MNLKVNWISKSFDSCVAKDRLCLGISKKVKYIIVKNWFLLTIWYKDVIKLLSYEKFNIVTIYSKERINCAK